MEARSVLLELKKNPVDSFSYGIVEVNSIFKDVEGHSVRSGYDYDLLKIDFTGHLAAKYKPTIMLWCDGRVVVIIDVNGCGTFCFPLTGYNEHLRERLSFDSCFKDFAKDESRTQELLEVCDWIQKAVFNIYA